MPPVAPSVVVFGPLAGGRGVSLLAAVPGPPLATAGYVETELAASGEAVHYLADDLPEDGRFVLRAGVGSGQFCTRVLLRMPPDAGRFNGTLVVEWLNVSSGSDAAPDYTYLAAELMRGGYAWAGVSAQYAGVEGGRSAVALPGEEDGDRPTNGLRHVDPDRYGGLSHPGDAYCYDLFGQVAAALAEPGEGGPLSGFEVERILAVGESQSAFALTTYANGVQPLTSVFDGFLIHSRARSCAPLGEPGCGLDTRQVVGGDAVHLRDDLAAPVILVQTETDLLGRLDYLPARQPDGARLRLWEVAGSAHADRFVIGEAEPFLGCAEPVNRGQQSFVVRAALRHLDAWVRDGAAPPHAGRLETRESAGSPAFVLDDVGNVEGGVRTPAVEVPVEVLSGLAAPGASYLCSLFGRTQPLEPDRLVALHGSVTGYLDRYRDAAQRAVEAGFVLPEDLPELLADARPWRS